ncbi:acetyltransferase [Peribacillus cavernae]|uniref:Acetyltransferase n=1 Tax=Peribacillus cavernae TaxID=1674310 RepID=A0A3S0TY65_9BACI|nr:acetyltransferase [Peribacillus cavernae]MDQ0217489.1 acetyltransferase EpsM [Peribacillus cavernae]RUQ30070.1 acetyltransferase [Peribacillus cavernae]
MKVIILGNGGHSKVIQEMVLSLKDHEIIAVLDDKYVDEHQKKGTIYAPFSSLKKMLVPGTRVVIAIGNNRTRKRIARSLALRQDQLLTVIHPSAIVSPSAVIGYGTVVMPQAVINAEAQIGEHCIINTAAIVEHENMIGNYTHLSPNATLTGEVSVGEGVHIGASATIIPGMHIGSWSIIGAGSTVIHDIPAACTAAGCPARILKSEKEQ